MLLVEWKLLPLPLLYLSAFFERHREDYGNLLYAVSEKGAWHEWITFFLRRVAYQARDAVQRAKRLQDLQQEWRSRLAQERALATVRLMESLFDTPIVTIPAAQRTLGITYPAAQRHVEKLVRLGILGQIGDFSYGRRFRADKVLEAIGSWDAQQEKELSIPARNDNSV